MNEQPTIVVLEFKTEYKKGQDGEGVAVDWVKYAPIHAVQTLQVWARVDKMKPPEASLRDDDDGKKMQFMHHRWDMISPAYTAWKDGQEIPVNGTPLALWPGVTSDQAQVIVRMGIRTVEEVAAMTDSIIQKLPLPNARELPIQARAFLEATDRASAAEEMTNRDSKITALEEQLAAAMELLEEKQVKPKPAAKKAA